MSSEKRIQEVFRKGKKKMTSKFVFYFLENSSDVFRIAIFLPKRVLKRAVDRNRARRLIREAFRSQLERWKGWDCLCILKRISPPELKLKEILKDLTYPYADRNSRKLT